jgi:hypothetical protein
MGMSPVAFLCGNFPPWHDRRKQWLLVFRITRGEIVSGKRGKPVLFQINNLQCANKEALKADSGAHGAFASFLPHARRTSMGKRPLMETRKADLSSEIMDRKSSGPQMKEELCPALRGGEKISVDWRRTRRKRESVCF